MHVLFQLVHIDAQCAEVFLSQLNLAHQLLVRIRAVVESEDTPAETNEQVSTEGNESPEGELRKRGLVAGPGENQLGDALTTGTISC